MIAQYCAIMSQPILRAPVLIADNFLPLAQAQAMRADIDAHFAHPDRHRADSHQVWNYWFVPGLYTYLRTAPERIIAISRLDGFMQALRGMALTTIGMGTVSAPYLSLYVAGCQQGWHNDATNGRFAFVYSLTSDTRRSTGGETLVMREGDPMRSHLRRPAAGSSFYEAIAPRFNRLVVFDDRMPHAVAAVVGDMNPAEGRFVLHGHLSEAPAAVAGALPARMVAPLIGAALADFATEAAASVALYHGPLSLRVTIAPGGEVGAVEVLLDRVIHPDAGHADWEMLRARLLDRIAGLRFPPAAGPTSVIHPVLFGRSVSALERDGR